MDPPLTEQTTPGTEETPASSPSLPESPAAEPAPTPAPTELPPTLELSVDPDSLDADGFTSLWNIAASTTGGDTVRARALSSKFLGFLCKHQSPLVVASTTDLTYLDEWFERDHSLLYNWNVDSDKVDVVAQHAQVPFEVFKRFLADRKFLPTANYSPRRADRVKWFQEVWAVG